MKCDNLDLVFEFPTKNYSTLPNFSFLKANLHVAIIERAAVSDRQQSNAIQSPCSKSLGAHYFK